MCNYSNLICGLSFTKVSTGANLSHGGWQGTENTVSCKNTTQGEVSSTVP